MILYHYTAAQHLTGIGKHGLTIGDVPTDLRRCKGRVGVWLTSSPESTGHGLSGTSLLKRRYRLTVEISKATPVVKWEEWAAGNVTPETINNLKHYAGADGKSQWQTWFIRLGVIPPSAIVACWDTIEDREVNDWHRTSSLADDAVAVPAWRREIWHRSLLKAHERNLRRIEASGRTIVY